SAQRHLCWRLNPETLRSSTAVKFGHADVAQLLMAHGADPNQKWAGGRNVLSCVLAEGFNKDPALIRLLIDRGASVNQAEDGGCITVDHSRSEGDDSLNAVRRRVLVN